MLNPACLALHGGTLKLAYVSIAGDDSNWILKRFIWTCLPTFRHSESFAFLPLNCTHLR